MEVDLSWCIACGRRCDRVYCSVECRRRDLELDTADAGAGDDGAAAGEDEVDALDESFLDRVDLAAFAPLSPRGAATAAASGTASSALRMWTMTMSTPTSVAGTPSATSAASSTTTSPLLRPQAAPVSLAVASLRPLSAYASATPATGSAAASARARSAGRQSPPPQLLAEIRQHRTSTLLKPDLPRRRGLPFWQEIYAEQYYATACRGRLQQPVATIRLTPIKGDSPSQATLHH